jgi:hypothetical protein
VCFGEKTVFSRAPCSILRTVKRLSDPVNNDKFARQGKTGGKERKARFPSQPKHQSEIRAQAGLASFAQVGQPVYLGSSLVRRIVAGLVCRLLIRVASRCWLVMAVVIILKKKQIKHEREGEKTPLPNQKRCILDQSDHSDQNHSQDHYFLGLGRASIYFSPSLAGPEIGL